MSNQALNYRNPQMMPKIILCLLHVPEASTQDLNGANVPRHVQRNARGQTCTSMLVVDMEPLPMHKAPAAWHAEILDALQAEWTASKMSDFSNGPEYTP